jgi:hypothetical protein
MEAGGVDPGEGGGGMTYGCTCGRNPATWMIVHWRCNYSAFNGYRHTPSDYSLVTCLKCRRSWRTKAAYTNTLPVLTNIQRERWSQGTLISV